MAPNVAPEEVFKIGTKEVSKVRGCWNGEDKRRCTRPELTAVVKPEQVQQKLQISCTTFFRLVLDGKLPGAEQIKTIMYVVNYYKYLNFIILWEA